MGSVLLILSISFLTHESALKVEKYCRPVSLEGFSDSLGVAHRFDLGEAYVA